MWFTHSKKTSMERFSVLSWWATSVQREVTTHLVRHICHTHIHWHTQAPIFVSLFQISEDSHAYRFDLAYHYCISLHLSHTLTLSSLISFLLVFISVLSLFVTEALITAINNDIEEAKVKLELPEHLKLREDNFFTSARISSSAVPPTTASTSQTIMNGHWQLAVTAAQHSHTRGTTRFCIHTGVCVCMYSLKSTPLFWDVFAVTVAAHGPYHKQPIFFFFFNLFFIFFADQSVFKEMFNFLYGFVADIQPLYSIGICIYLDQLSNQTALQCMKLLDLSRPPV